MRKAYYVRLSQVKDEQAYSLLLNCRHCTHDQLREYISKNRVKSYMKAKLIEKNPYAARNGLPTDRKRLS